MNREIVFKKPRFDRPKLAKQTYEGKRESIFPVSNYLLQKQPPKKEVQEFENLYSLYDEEGYRCGVGIVSALYVGGSKNEYHILTNENGILVGFYLFSLSDFSNLKDKNRYCPCLNFFYLIPSERRKRWFTKIYTSLVEKHGLIYLDHPNKASLCAARKLGYDEAKTLNEYAVEIDK
ncbi:hypothetical protein ACFL17_04280 [Pseudomonadota bacterium]